MKKKSIAIIGGGNLGSAIAEGLLKSGTVDPAQITVSRRKVSKLQNLKDQGIRVTGDNIEAVQGKSIIILAIKPFQIRRVLEELVPVLDPSSQVLASVVTGVSIADMQEVVGKEIVIFRAMPNTAISVRESMTSIASSNASEDQIEMMINLFNQLGVAVSIDESKMSAATVLGASGTAFALRYIRAQSQAGIEIGLSADVAKLIATQTAKGAAQLLLETGHHPEFEIDKVTTPQGCTIAGLNEMEHEGFSSALIKGISACHKKIEEIKKEY